MTLPYEIKNNRIAEYPIDRIFLDRWSPRSISSKNFTEKDLFTLFEAARWTPSSSNGQPWRFIYAIHNSPQFEIFFSLLGEFNQIWCKTAGALIVLISNKTFDDGTSDKLHSFGAGSAFMSFALQAKMKNLVAHGMQGFDYKKAKELLKVPEDYNVECMIGVGTQGSVEDLHERMQKSEKPNERKPLKQLIANGKFPAEWK